MGRFAFGLHIFDHWTWSLAIYSGLLSIGQAILYKLFDLLAKSYDLFAEIINLLAKSYDLFA